MYKLLKHIIAMVFFGLLLASCSEDRAQNMKDIGVFFTISVPNAEVGSRANDAELTEDGTLMESSVDPNQLHVVLYDNDGNVMAALQQISLIQLGKNEYKVIGAMKVAEANFRDNLFLGKVVVYANIDGVDEKARYASDAIGELSYDYTPNPHLIAMWGVKQVANKQFLTGKQTDIGTINLLRAEAKMTVNLSQDMIDNGYELTQVSLTKHNTKGYCLPKVEYYQGLDDVDNLVHDKYLHVFDSSVSTEPVDMKGKSIYVPEFNNKDVAESDRATIKLKLKERSDGTEEDYTLQFVNYKEGAPTTEAYNIERNHHYKFEVYKGSNGKLHVNLVVRKWAKDTHPTITM